MWPDDIIVFLGEHYGERLSGRVNLVETVDLPDILLIGCFTVPV